MKVFFQCFVVVALVAVFAVLLFVPSRVDVAPASREEADAARDFLRASLTNPRFTYIEFIGTREHMKHHTPNWDGIVTMSNPVGPQGYAIYTVEVPAEGLYSFVLTYDIPGAAFNPLVVSLWVNDERQFNEAATITLPIIWQDESKDFPVNRFGDQISPMQMQVPGPHSVALFDASHMTDSPLLFHLQAGANTIEIRNETAIDLYLGDLHIYSARDLPTFTPPTGPTYPGLIMVNSIDHTHANSSFVQLMSLRNPGLTPFHPVDRMINTVSMSRSGDEVFYTMEIPEDGYYAITLHALTFQDDFPVFVTVKVNGEVPFQELASFPLVPQGAEQWRNYTLTDNDGNPLYIFLPQGTHEISIRLELSPIARHLETLRLLVDHINQFNLEILRVTGRDIDRNRTWHLTRYIPDAAAYLDAYDVILREMMHDLATFSPRGLDSTVASNIVTALTRLDRLRERPDELPLFIEMLNGTHASVLQMTGVTLDNLVVTGIALNAIYLGRAYDLPRERAPWYERMGAGIQNLWASYTSDKFVVRNRDEAINIWVNHSYLHVDILQRMIDTQFTPETGIEVNLSVMPDVQRLIMSRAAGTNPDAALGLPSHMPFELASRGALYDLTNFDNFWEFMGDFVPGALVSYVFNEGVFAMPETVNFAATVYRTDILGQLGLDPPDTWADVAAMQSELLRFDMSFFKPIASGVGYKWFFQTTPLIYQHGGLLYQPDGMATAIDQAGAVEGITFLSSLFTTFALAEQVPVFFNAFRFGQTPVGIMDAGMYMLLQHAAPELLGQWSLAPFPGTVQEDGSISRWFVANGAGAVIFENTERPDDVWQFFQWYLDADTQQQLAFDLFSNYRIIWLPSNLEALSHTPIDHRDLEVLMDSMQWLRDVPRSPGQYMLERRLSDIWNTIVFDGTPPRVAIDLRTIDINREFTRKMVEFGFIDAEGNQLRPFVVREIDWVIEQIENARR